MLEVRHLSKIYRPKKGIPVTALKDINITFPDTGMVFLVGKSGSGKSTLLNVLGGLDRYDQGEIIIKGVSSRDFRQRHFDSYRNTYVGFIFQEYNILEEFTVGANIMLALQLQGRKATDAELNEILEEVDLAGYGNRRPNELSGGQKQRVAIARALVKKPEIIMADEPTGALDSTTGRQVLETLKRLSDERLVLVVSHDREFAEQYADRIIELADGEIVRDVERVGEPLPEEEKPVSFGEDGIEIQAGYQLTEEDRQAINAYLAAEATGRVSLWRREKRKASFLPTDPEKIPHQKGGNFKLIRSRLPLKNAFRIGGSSLKYKKLRLVVTIFLSCVAFSLFGLADTFSAYQHEEVCTKSIMDTGIRYASISRQVSREDYWINTNGLQEELAAFERETGVHLKGVSSFSLSLSFEDQIDPESDRELYAAGFTGFTALTQDDLRAMGYSLQAGRLPEGDAKELAVSSYLAETFVQCGYRPYGAEEYQRLSSREELLGKTLTLNGTDYTVVGIVDTRLDLSRYQSLTDEEEQRTTAEELILYALQNEFRYVQNYSLARVAMVSGEVFADLAEEMPPVSDCVFGNIYFYNDTQTLAPYKVGRLADFAADEILWLDGERKELAENEIIISADFLTPGNGEEPFDATSYPSDEELAAAAAEIGALSGNLLYYYEDCTRFLSDIRIVGVLPMENRDERGYNAAIVADPYYQALTFGGEYEFAVGGMPEGRDQIRGMIEYCYNSEDSVRYPLMNSVTYELDMVNDVLKTMAKVFLYIGLGFALFAALMLANFIATSIAHKKQEIGILRAIGSRGSDVFRIFFSESFIIAMINFVLSSIGVGLASAGINWILRENGILISVLTFGPRQILLLLAVSLFVAAVSSYLPVRRIAAKRPIDAIRNR